ncbi:MAG TPA: 2-aminoethylphosphonate--pyruvate transaminase [Candidatus Competibacter sp.]|nr:2-aminoethylphosphonate--pyruvate transaminase [Candidatus Competibacter sp.]HUM95775.1 2-aminoethylphosphonate--pyruvate transaminase [Candidatus Competibacter sp.]
MNEAREPYLLTPGPLTTSMATKTAMLRDWGSWDEDFNGLTASVCRRLLEAAHATETHVCVPLQGSGTYAVEAALATLLPWDSKTLVLTNGAYGQRMIRILKYLGRDLTALDMGDYFPPSPSQVDAMLADDPAISHVAVVHCETSSGILNPLEAIAEVVHRWDRRLFVDAMSSFGALPIDARALPFDGLASSANKCFEGVPGFSFALLRRDVLKDCADNAHSLSLDLYDQWDYMNRTGQWRFTPPTQVVAAFASALDQHGAEGGVAGRLARYTRNKAVLVEGMRAMGFHTLLDDRWLSPIIVTFHAPGHSNFNFKDFYQSIKRRGFIIYPGKLTQVESFRIGCIGQLFEEQMRGALAAVRAALDEMAIPDGAPRLEDLTKPVF